MKRQKQILIVEDNRLNREILSDILSEQYVVLEAENGQDALDILKVHRYDISLILLDVRMPVMDGFTFLDRIKQDAELSLIPVIVMTQSDDENDEITALTHGATDFVPKPYRPQVILHRVASLISLRENASMANQFKYDQLTGLYGKEFFYQKVRELLRDDPEGKYNIVCCNVENFKLYNDTFGMAAGDRLLQEIAGFMRQRAGNDGVCGRLRADRFACIRACTMADMQHCFADVENELKKSERAKNVVLKWGIYAITDRTVPVESMCDRVLLAVDSIKGRYNQNLAVYDDALRSKLLREQAITETMEPSLEAGQFFLCLQPKYNLSDGCMSGEEALVRWNHPELGFLPPGEFIPLFEKNGFITRLDKYVWEQGCILLRRWIDAGLEPAPLSVNVSRADIYQTDLADTLTGLMRKYDLDPAWLHLEITESAYTENPGQIIRTVDELRKLGFIIELDDFGSGYSSLNMLNQMKLDVLKLDMNFIQGEMAKSPEQGILRSIVGLAHWMNLTVVAEGVETREQVERLQTIGCDFVQGYYFARPMPVEDFEAMLRDKPRQALAEAPQQEPRPEKPCLLVVDDTPKSRKLIRKALEEQYTVLEAETVDEALNCLMHHGGEISTVVLSLTLPGDGTAAVLSTLRSQPQTWQVPVLAMSSWERGLPQEDYALDVNDISFKPRDELCLNCLRRRVEWLHILMDSQERERHLKDEAYRDYLTGLLNRRGLEAALDAMGEADYPLTVYLFDLDNLKRINDRQGHEAGDRMLRRFSEVLRANTRDGDILCRYGGDEFVVLLRNVDSEEAILQKGEALCRGFGTCGQEGEFSGACSVGAVKCEKPGEPITRLLDKAVQALHRAKREHKGGCCLWDSAAD